MRSTVLASLRNLLRENNTAIPVLVDTGEERLVIVRGAGLAYFEHVSVASMEPGPDRNTMTITLKARIADVDAPTVWPRKLARQALKILGTLDGGKTIY